jgi:drug/metabolite transporter (DMT)-like permease
MFVVPVAGGVASHLVLGETFDTLKLAGTALILLGLALVRRAAAAPARASAASSPTGGC